MSKENKYGKLDPELTAISLFYLKRDEKQSQEEWLASDARKLIQNFSLVQHVDRT